MRTSSTPDVGTQDLTITRIIDAPRSVLFKAWTESDQVAKWWGPSGFTNPVCEVDARPGGAIRIDMRGPDGVVYPMEGTFHEIDEPHRIVFTSTAMKDEDGNPQLEVHNTVTFDEESGKTRLTLHAVVVNATEAAEGALAGMNEGWSQSLNKLEGYATSTFSSTADREVVTTRILDAPRSLVFRMWTEEEHIGHWYGPRGFTITTKEMNVSPGGVWLFTMHGPDGVDYPNRIVYKEILSPERLVFDHGTGEDDGFDDFHVTVTFDEDGTKTRLTLRSLFDTAEQREMVVREYGAVEGAQQTVERLAAYIAGLS